MSYNYELLVWLWMEHLREARSQQETVRPSSQGLRTDRAPLPPRVRAARSGRVHCSHSSPGLMRLPSVVELLSDYSNSSHLITLLFLPCYIHEEEKTLAENSAWWDALSTLRTPSHLAALSKVVR